MKKRLLILSMIFCMGLATIACGKDETTQETSEALESVDQSVEDTGSAETTEDSEEIAEETAQTEVWCGYLEA